MVVGFEPIMHMHKLARTNMIMCNRCAPKPFIFVNEREQMTPQGFVSLRDPLSIPCFLYFKRLKRSSTRPGLEDAE